MANGYARYSSLGGGSGGGGSGTVTSVALSDGSIIPLYAISGSPVTATGTLTFTLNTQPANTLLAGPTTGATAQPTFRPLVAADLNTLIVPTANGGTGLASPGAVGNVLRSNGTIWTSLPLSGSSAFAAYASSQVTTDSSSVTSGSYINFSNSPAFTFTPTITGTYKVYASVTASIGGASNAGQIRIHNTSGGATLLQESALEIASSTATLINGNYVQSNYTLTAGVSYVFDIQGLALNGSISLVGSNANFYMFAEGIGLEGLLSPSSYNYNGYYPGSISNYWSTASASYVAFTVSGTIPTITQLTNNNFGVVSNATASDAGVNFVAVRTGVIRVNFNISSTSESLNQITSIRLFETSNSTLLGYAPSVYLGVNTTTSVPRSVVGYLSVTQGLTYNVVVQGKTSSNNLYINAEGGDMQLGVTMEYVS